MYLGSTIPERGDDDDDDDDGDFDDDDTLMLHHLAGVMHAVSQDRLFGLGSLRALSRCTNQAHPGDPVTLSLGLKMSCDGWWFVVGAKGNEANTSLSH